MLLPIFIARQWIRHRTANVNEYSARYSILDKEFYLPSPDNLAAKPKHRQGRGDILEGEKAKQVLDLLKEMRNKPIIIMKLCLIKDMMVQ